MCPLASVNVHHVMVSKPAIKSSVAANLTASTICQALIHDPLPIRSGVGGSSTSNTVKAFYPIHSHAFITGT